MLYKNTWLIDGR